MVEIGTPPHNEFCRNQFSSIMVFVVRLVALTGSKDILYFDLGELKKEF